MTFIGHAVLFFLSGFTQYLMAFDRRSNLGVVLMLSLPVAGVYFLGWWALLTVFVGVLWGARIWASAKAAEEQTRQR